MLGGFLLYPLLQIRTLKTVFKRILYILFLSIFLTSLLSLVLYYLGIFRLANLFFSFLLVNILLIIVIRLQRKDIFSLFKDYSSLLDLADLGFLFIIVFLLIILSFYSQFGIISGNDSFNHLLKAYRIDGFLNLELPEGQNLFKLPFTIKNSLPLFPLWIALILSMFGLKAVFLLNSFFLVVALGVIYLFAYINFNERIALIASILLAFNLGEIFTAKILLREILSQLLIFGFLLLFSVANSTRKFSFLFTALLCLFLSFFTRPEFLLIVPLLFIFLILNNVDFTRFIKLKFSIFLSLLTCLFIYLGSVCGYGQYSSLAFYKFFILDFLKRFKVFPVPFFVIAIAIFAMIVFVLRKQLLSFCNRFGKENLGLILSLSLFIFAYFVRPIYFYSSPFFSSDVRDIIRANQPNFDLISLERLGYFLPVIIIFLAILGAFAFLKTKKSISLPIQVFLVSSFVYSCLFLIDPFHDLNIRFWIRRFVPIIIPGILIFFAVGIKFLNFGNRTKQIVLTLVLVICASIFFPSSIIQEYDSLFGSLKDFSNKFDREDVLLFYYPEDLRCDYKIAGALRMLFGKRVFVTDKIDDEIVAEIKNLIGEQNSLYLISFQNFKSYQFGQEAVLYKDTIDFQRLEWTFFKVPERSIKINIPLYLYKI